VKSRAAGAESLSELTTRNAGGKVEESEFKQRVSRLEAIGKVLEKLPAEVRSDAFSLLRGYVDGAELPPPAATKRKHKDDEHKRKEPEGDDSPGDFFSKFDHDEAADNVRLITAYFYREYGTQPFSVEEVQRTADKVGLTVPKRIDMTLVAATENGKKLYNRSGRGKFEITVHGEKHLKETYAVRKGTKRRAEDENAE
jgi:hypothetical protein